MDADSCLILFLTSDMELDEVIHKTHTLAKTELSNYKNIHRHKRSCASTCYKSNIGSLDAHKALEFINKTLTDEIDAGLVLKRETIDALNEVKRILILTKR